MKILVADTYVWYNLYKGKYDTDKINENQDRFASTLINVEELLSTPRNKSKIACVLFNAINYTIYKPKFYSALIWLYEGILKLYIKYKGTPYVYPPLWFRWLYDISQPKSFKGFLIGNDAMVELSRELNGTLPIVPFLSHEKDYLISSEYVANMCKIKWYKLKAKKEREEVFSKWHDKGRLIRKKRKIFKSHLDQHLQKLHDKNFITQNDDYTKLIPTVEKYLCEIVLLYERKVIKSGFSYPSNYHWPNKKLLVHFASITFFRYLRGALGKPAVTETGKINVDENDVNDLLNFCYHKPGYVYFLGEKRWKSMYDKLCLINHTNFDQNHAIKDIDYFR